MSHYTCLVIGNDPEKQLAPYSENLDVAPYIVGVVDEESKQDMLDYYNEKKGPEYYGDPNAVERFRRKAVLQNLISAPADDLSWPEVAYADFETCYAIHGDSWNRNRWKQNAEGIWEEWSTYNPKSKWDWYQLGGRWQGLFTLRTDIEGARGVGQIPEADSNSLPRGDYEVRNNGNVDAAKRGHIANFEDVVRQNVFAILKRGEWHEKGEMGWFAIVRDEKPNDEWEAQKMALIADVDDDEYVSLYDLHI